MTDLQKMFEWFKQELTDYENKTKIDFLLKYEHNFKDEVIKDYKVYMKDNEDEDPEELLAFDEWIEQYSEEVSDELTEKINWYFNDYGIENYKAKHSNIWDIITAWWWPNIYLRVESKWDKVTWKGYWWGEEIIEDISQYYDTIYDLYFLTEE